MTSATAEESQLFTNDAARFLVGLIADYETTIGFVLAGIGEFLDASRKHRNFMLIDDETPKEKIEAFFHILCESKRIGVILLGTDAYAAVRELVAARQKAVPIIIEIPSRKSLEKKRDKQDD